MILLIRHCTPDIDYTKCNYKKALHRLNEYNTTSNIKHLEILGIEDKLQKLIDLTNIKIFCSTSPRASTTANYLFPDNTNIVFSDRFLEFDLSIFYIPFLRCGIRTWFFISRILWFIGIFKTDNTISHFRSSTRSANGEERSIDETYMSTGEHDARQRGDQNGRWYKNFQQERSRAKDCASLLETEANTSDVVLVAHGLLNSFIEKYLKENGWRKVYSYSNGCFSVKGLQRV